MLRDNGWSPSGVKWSTAHFRSTISAKIDGDVAPSCLMSDQRPQLMRTFVFCYRISHNLRATGSPLTSNANGSL